MHSLFMGSLRPPCRHNNTQWSILQKLINPPVCLQTVGGNWSASQGPPTEPNYTRNYYNPHQEKTVNYYIFGFNNTLPRTLPMIFILRDLRSVIHLWLMLPEFTFCIDLDASTSPYTECRAPGYNYCGKNGKLLQ